MESRIQSRQQPSFIDRWMPDSTSDLRLPAAILNYVTAYNSRVNLGLNRCPVRSIEIPWREKCIVEK
ncbi:MAG: hypothetical protein ACRC62_31615 [Microcoleus sp.]